MLEENIRYQKCQTSHTVQPRRTNGDDSWHEKLLHYVQTEIGPRYHGKKVSTKKLKKETPSHSEKTEPLISRTRGMHVGLVLVGCLHSIGPECCMQYFYFTIY